MPKSIISELAVPETRQQRLEKSKEKAEKIAEKLVELQNKLSQTQRKWGEKREELRQYLGSGTRKEETLRGQVARLDRRMKKLEEEVDAAQKKHDEAQGEYKRIRGLVTKLEGMQAEEAGIRLDPEMEELVRKLVSLSQQMTALGKQREGPTLLLREFIEYNFTGFTHSEKEEELGNKVWISRSGKAMCVLVPNPKYSIPVERGLTEIGLEAITPFLKIDYPRFRNAVKAEQVKDKEGETVTLERLELLRDRKEQPHKVVASLVGEEVGEIVFAILDPELVEQNVEALETLRGVDKATITALKKNGIETVGQLGKKDWYAISLLKGIGEKRAGRIHLAIRKLVRKRIAQR